MSAPAVRYIAAALPDPDVLLAQLVREVAWLDTMRARKTASFGVPYNYSGQTYPARPFSPAIRAIADHAERLAGHDFDNCLCNRYDTGAHAMGFHRDAYDDLVPDSWIAIASLGATRSLVFRDNERTQRHAYPLEHGSILLMDRATQLAWQHALPPVAASGLRISITFRRFRYDARP